MRRFPPPRVFVLLTSAQVVLCLAGHTDGDGGVAAVPPSDQAAGSNFGKAVFGACSNLGGGPGGDPPRKEEWWGVLAKFYCAQELCSYISLEIEGVTYSCKLYMYII